MPWKVWVIQVFFHNLSTCSLYTCRGVSTKSNCISKKPSIFLKFFDWVIKHQSQWDKFNLPCSGYRALSSIWKIVRVFFQILVKDFRLLRSGLKEMPFSFRCSPAIGEWLWKKAQIEKKTPVKDSLANSFQTFKDKWKYWKISLPAFICPKPTMKTLGQCLKSVQSYINNIRTTSLMSFWCLYC